METKKLLNIKCYSSMDLPPVYKYVQGNITKENTKKKLFTELWRAKTNHFLV